MASDFDLQKWADSLADEVKARQDAAAVEHAAKPFRDYEAMRARNPWLARTHYDQHADEIEAARKVVNAKTAPAPTEAQKDAAALAETNRRRDDAAAVNRFNEFRTLQKTNPFLAARIINSEPETIERGRRLSKITPPDDDGPKAA